MEIDVSVSEDYFQFWQSREEHPLFPNDASAISYARRRPPGFDIVPTHFRL
jgi:hypothetical protein